jgi:hypothetical protein
MKWIVLSNSTPARLHALLESAKDYLSNLVPEVLAKYKCIDTLQAYGRVASRFRIHLHGGEDDWRQSLLDIVSAQRTDGKFGQLTLITQDTMLFCGRPDIRCVWEALKDPNLLGVSLCLSSKSDSTPSIQDRVSGKHTWYVWHWDELRLQSPLGDAFSYGTVYRTTDLLGTMARCQWDSTETLRSALCSDPALRRRTRMACLEEASLVDRPADPFGSTDSYLGNYVIDIAKLQDDPLRYQWRPFKEES